MQDLGHTCGLNALQVALSLSFEFVLEAYLLGAPPCLEILESETPRAQQRSNCNSFRIGSSSLRNFAIQSMSR